MTIAKVKPKVWAPELTPRQVEVLRAINRRNPDGSLLDIYQLMKAVRHTGTRQAMTYQLGHLAAHGLIELAGSERRGSNRPSRLFQITNAGRILIRPRSLPGDAP